MPVETNEPIPTMGTKLSETVSDIWSRDEAQGDGPVKPEYRAMYDAARALEERVERLENSQASWDRVVEQQDAINAATARAEAAEARATNLDRQCDDLGEELERIEKQLYEACGERDVAEHEVARLKAFNLPSDHAMRVAHKMHKEVTDERDALRAKLEKVRSACKEAAEFHAGFEEDALPRDILAILDGEGDE